MITFPHCDPRVLHAPSEGCEVCNMHPDWQELRVTWKINFTGGRAHNFIACPSELERPIGTINRWAGNRPYHAPAVPLAPLVLPLGAVVNGHCDLQIVAGCTNEEKPLLSFRVEDRHAFACRGCADYQFDTGAWRLS